MKKYAKFIGLIALFCFGTTTSFAFIVSAPAVEAQLAILNGKTTISDTKRAVEAAQQIQKWLQQAQQMKQVITTGVQQVQEIKNDIERAKQEFGYWKNIKGNWRDIIARVRTTATDSALGTGTFSGTPILGGTTLYGDDDSTGKVIGQAIDDLNKLINAKETGQAMTGRELRESLQKIIGFMPQSDTSGVSAMAQTNIEDTISFLAKANKAMDDLLIERARVRGVREQAINSSQGLTEAQKTQYEMADQDLQSQMNSLQTQAMLRVSQQLMVQNSFSASNYNRAEQMRISDRKLREAMSGLAGFELRRTTR